LAWAISRGGFSQRKPDPPPLRPGAWGLSRPSAAANYTPAQLPQALS